MTKTTRTSDRRTFGSVLRQARQDAGLSQQQLADAASVSREHISRLENGDGVPGSITLNALASALSCGVEKLSSALQSRRAKRAA